MKRINPAMRCSPMSLYFKNFRNLRDEAEARLELNEEIYECFRNDFENPDVPKELWDALDACETALAEEHEALEIEIEELERMFKAVKEFNDASINLRNCCGKYLIEDDMVLLPAMEF